MGRTEFPDLQLIESEPWLDTALFLIERNGALRSARISMLKKNLTSAGIVRDAPVKEILGCLCRLFGTRLARRATRKLFGPEVGFGEIVTHLLQARLWIASG